MNQAFPKRFFDEMGLVPLLDHLHADSRLDFSRTAVYGPDARWCGRGERVTAPPIPIGCRRACKNLLGSGIPFCASALSRVRKKEFCGLI